MLQDFRLLGTAASLGRFTLHELSAVSGITYNSVRSWMSNKGSIYFEKISSSGAVGRGAPKKIWGIKEGAGTALQARIDEIQREVLAPPLIKGEDEALNELEQQFNRWIATRHSKHGKSLEESEQAATRTLVRIAWEKMATLAAAGHEPDENLLIQIAERERDLGAGAMPINQPLASSCAWLARRLQDMVARAVPDRFAARAFHIRGLVRRPHDQAWIIGASISATVIGDEAWDDAELSVTDAERSSLVADFSSPSVLRSGAEQALLLFSQHPQSDSLASQTIARGVTALASCRRSIELSNWLIGLRYDKAIWKPELAPVSLHGVGRIEPKKLPALKSDLENQLQVALDQQMAQPGKLRREVLDYARHNLQLMSKRADELAQSDLGAMVGTYFGSVELDYEPLTTETAL
jgi:hypothetical protein